MAETSFELLLQQLIQLTIKAAEIHEGIAQSYKDGEDLYKELKQTLDGTAQSKLTGEAIAAMEQVQNGLGIASVHMNNLTTKLNDISSALTQLSS